MTTRGVGFYMDTGVSIKDSVMRDNFAGVLPHLIKKFLIPEGQVLALFVDETVLQNSLPRGTQYAVLP